MASNVAKRNNALFDELKLYFNYAEIVELTGLCAVCSQADLMDNALRIPLESAAEVGALNRSLSVDPEKVRTYLSAVLADWSENFASPGTMGKTSLT